MIRGVMVPAVLKPEKGSCFTDVVWRGESREKKG